MSFKVYVGNLPFSFGDKELLEAFSPFGEISEATVIVDKYSKRSKGFGFVTFNDEAAGKKAIEEMNGKEVSGREIKVNEARPREEGQYSQAA
jgi:cold-inducible RNA-binding protein